MKNTKISFQARGLEMDKRKLNLFKRLKDHLSILLPLIFRFIAISILLFSIAWIGSRMIWSPVTKMWTPF